LSKIFCIVDGMTDPQFSPSDYPALSSMNCIGSVDTARGLDVESLNCILHLLGVDHIPPHLRGYAEALGVGIPIEKEDLIFRGSWFSLDEKGCFSSPIEGPASLSSSGKVRYYKIGTYQSILIFPGMQKKISHIKTFPPYLCAGRPAKELAPQGDAFLKDCFLNWLTPKQGLIPWGESVPSSLPPFPEKAAAVAGASIVKGIARLLHMTLIPVSGATGETDTDLAGKTAAALEAAQRYPFVLLHLNGADEAAHRKNPKEKAAFLQKADRIVFQSLVSSGHEIILTSDHGTDPATGKHIGGEQSIYSIFTIR
jgi:2,3-bisphosphoglycerate-independent phosphoglycerate mutase